MKPMYKRAKIDVGLPAQSIASTSVTGTYFEMQMYRKALAILDVGAMDAENTATIEILQAKDAAGTGAKAITGASAAITATGTLASGCAFVEVDVSSLDLANGFEYIAIKVTTNATLNAAAILVRGDGRFEPVQDVNASASV